MFILINYLVFKNIILLLLTYKLLKFFRPVSVLQLDPQPDPLEYKNVELVQEVQIDELVHERQLVIVILQSLHYFGDEVYA